MVIEQAPQQRRRSEGAAVMGETTTSAWGCTLGGGGVRARGWRRQTCSAVALARALDGGAGLGELRGDDRMNQSSVSHAII
jgi:hypothetical protein